MRTNECPSLVEVAGWVWASTDYKTYCARWTAVWLNNKQTRTPDYPMKYLFSRGSMFYGKKYGGCGGTHSGLYGLSSAPWKIRNAKKYCDIQTTAENLWVRILSREAFTLPLFMCTWVVSDKYRGQLPVTISELDFRQNRSWQLLDFYRFLQIVAMHVRPEEI